MPELHQFEVRNKILKAQEGAKKECIWRLICLRQTSDEIAVGIWTVSQVHIRSTRQRGEYSVQSPKKASLKQRTKT